MKAELTDEQVDLEIEKLNNSPLVQLARKEQRLKYAKRQRLYQLRYLEKRGQQLKDNGITLEKLEELSRQQSDENEESWC